MFGCSDPLPLRICDEAPDQVSGGIHSMECIVVADILCQPCCGCASGLIQRVPICVFQARKEMCVASVCREGARSSAASRGVIQSWALCLRSVMHGNCMETGSSRC